MYSRGVCPLGSSCPAVPSIFPSFPRYLQAHNRKRKPPKEKESLVTLPTSNEPLVILHEAVSVDEEIVTPSERLKVTEHDHSVPAEIVTPSERLKIAECDHSVPAEVVTPSERLKITEHDDHSVPAEIVTPSERLKITEHDHSFPAEINCIMVRSCSAVGCKERATKGTEVHFFRFPFGDPPRLENWVKAIRRKDFIPVRGSSVLCSKHFESSYIFVRNGKTVVSCGDPCCMTLNQACPLRSSCPAVPSIFPSFSRYLQAHNRKRRPPKERKSLVTLPTWNEPLVILHEAVSVDEEIVIPSERLKVTENDHSVPAEIVTPSERLKITEHDDHSVPAEIVTPSELLKITDHDHSVPAEVVTPSERLKIAECDHSVPAEVVTPSERLKIIEHDHSYCPTLSIEWMRIMRKRIELLEKQLEIARKKVKNEVRKGRKKDQKILDAYKRIENMKMMPDCFAYGCGHRSIVGEFFGPLCHMYSFPKDEDHFKIWEWFSRRRDREATADDWLCSCHFENGEVSNGPTKRFLPTKEALNYEYSGPSRKQKDEEDVDSLSSAFKSGGKKNEEEEGDERFPQPSTSSSREYFYDEIDDINDRREEGVLKLSRGKLDKKRKGKDKVAVLNVGSDALDSESEEDEEGEEDYASTLEKIRREVEQERMGSDLESDEESEGEVDDLGDWGTSLSSYRGADVVDKDYRGTFRPEDEEAAALEEQEAVALRNRILSQMTEADFDLDCFFPTTSTVTENAEEEPETQTDSPAAAKSKSKSGKAKKSSTPEEDQTEAVSDKELKKRIKKESPELEGLILEFREKLSELREIVLPALKILRSKLAMENAEETSKVIEPLVRFLELKKRLLVQYSVNLSFYFHLKATPGISIKDHPIVPTLLRFRTLCHELMRGDAKFQEVFEMILAKEADQENNEEEEEEVEVVPVQRSTKWEKIVVHESQDAEDMEEGVPASVEGDEMEEDEQEENEDGITMGKRAITYQIAKNKGLVAKKKKEYRNPRVKHRMKFRKAVIRRKGQVRAMRSEVKKYSGEASGIRAGVIRSRKFVS
ncbi:unnamed protein product [Cyprideis torosa]|uniref:Uncharacterized protein n=1 Tax=Cyprideis torosa TaxID=163714 RepID=A0A7R8WIW6_9CRUS|nr:unnamed protein product [Cyprideis torosa]CAG0898457.1 unnamed protein product [Cyprideis torosa]